MSLTIIYNKLGDAYKKAWGEISKLADEGWEPVSMITLERGFMTINASMHGGAGSSIADEVLVMLKRPLD